MNWKTILPFALLGLLTFTACDPEEEHMHNEDNKITISILSPMADEVITDASSVTISVEVSATDENHNLEVVLHPDGDLEDKIIDYDEHDHDAKLTFEQTVDLSSYPAGTEFHLEVEACIDHDCEEKEFADVEFSIQ